MHSGGALVRPSAIATITSARGAARRAQPRTLRYLEGLSKWSSLPTLIVLEELATAFTMIFTTAITVIVAVIITTAIAAMVGLSN